MARRPRTPGSISTFFSYKGGVGRTMALANVGFLSAMAGKRVLLMDWDLEAPGLAYYFRGLTSHVESGDIRRAHGVLNLFWSWVNGIDQLATEAELDAHIESFRKGDPFQNCVRSLISTKRLPRGARLDFIGAGSPLVDAPDPLPYADALSRFSWMGFFEHSAGGLMIEAMRDWCRTHYDVILVDSRTGLADVSGICTMQLPDSVILCFVLNRQNIEGVAQVASAIHGARGEDVAVRIAPMRVSQDRPTEEADARARAQRQLERAGLAAERVDHDMDRLAIPAAANVPFYETLAPFAASDPALDVLTLAYQGLTEAVVGIELSRPKIDGAWRDEVRRRLEPKLSTIEYLESLDTAEPARAREEIERFVLGALDADPSLELDPDYVQALVTVALSLQDMDWDGDEAQAERVGKNAIELLRRLHALGDGEWRLPLVTALDEFDSIFGQGRTTPRYLEMQDILAAGPQSLDILQRRFDLMLSQARSMLRGQGDETLKLMQEAEGLLKQMRAAKGASDELLALAVGEIANLRSAALVAAHPAQARAEAEKALNALKGAPSAPRTMALVASIHLRIARLETGTMEAARHVLAAGAIWPRSVANDVGAYVFAIETLLAGPNPEQHAVELLQNVFRKSEERHSIPQSRRSPLQLAQTEEEFASFAKTTLKLANLFGETRPQGSEAALAILAELAAQGLMRRMRRHSTRRSGQRGNEAIFRRFGILYETLSASGASDRSLRSFGEALAAFDNWRHGTGE